MNNRLVTKCLGIGTCQFGVAASSGDCATTLSLTTYVWGGRVFGRLRGHSTPYYLVSPPGGCVSLCTRDRRNAWDLCSGIQRSHLEPKGSRGVSPVES